MLTGDPKLRMAFRVGVTGKRDLAAENIDDLRRRIAETLSATKLALVAQASGGTRMKRQF